MRPVAAASARAAFTVASDEQEQPRTAEARLPLLVQLDSLIGVGGQFRTDREATAGGGGRTGRSPRRSQSAREHDVDAGLELYGANGRLVHWFWPFLPEAAEAVAHAGRFIRDVL
jgi:hypothetical protein